MLNSRFFRVYLLPGFVFQSIIIGGGYGTGRELVEWFMSQGAAWWPTRNAGSHSSHGSRARIHVRVR